VPEHIQTGFFLTQDSSITTFDIMLSSDFGLLLAK
jgi:hypothetical protein